MADGVARPPLPRRPRRAWPLLPAAATLLVVLAAHHLDLSLGALAAGGRDMTEYLGRYRAPDFSELPRYLALMGQTLAIALWATALAALLGGLLGPLAARNLAPHPAVYRAAREALNFLRAMPDLLLALLFVAALGLGPLPGALALGLHTAGFLGKFFAESMERVDGGVYEALAATGATRAQVVMYAAWPSVLREAVGFTAYVFDRNVRMASVLGLVGAGGIGLALHETLRFFDYGRSAALIAVLVVAVVCVDRLSSGIREALR